MKILLFGGTTEGRLLAGELEKRGHELTVSCATELGAEELSSLSCEILAGRLEQEEMAELVTGYELVVDATHPYAVLVTENIQESCRKKEIPYRRICREAGEEKDCFRVKSCREAAEYLGTKEGNILVTTGAKELAEYALLDPKRVYARVLPTHAGIEACERLGLPHRNIIALQGPFSRELNEAMLKQYEIKWMVTKDGGRAGGFEEKLQAASACGAQFILVERPEDQGMTMEAFLDEVDKRCR